MLLTLSRLDHPAAPAAASRLFRMVDPAGAWNECYDGEDRPIPTSIRANVWVSGINAVVLLEYLARPESKPAEPTFQPDKQPKPSLSPSE